MSPDSDSISMTTSPGVQAALAILTTTPESRARAARKERIQNRIKAGVAFLNVKSVAEAIARQMSYRLHSSAVISSPPSSASDKISDPPIVNRVLPPRQRISFHDLPDDLRFLIYEYICRGRQNFKTDVATLSPAWKSPQSPAALMNTCSSIAFEFMPFYFGGAQFTLDASSNDVLRDKALDWFEKIGDLHSAHFNNIRVVCGVYAECELELEIRVSRQRELTIREIKGPFVRPQGMSNNWPTWTLVKGLIRDLQSKLDERIKIKSTGFLGGADLRIIVESVHFHRSIFAKNMVRFIDGQTTDEPIQQAQKVGIVSRWMRVITGSSATAD